MLRPCWGNLIVITSSQEENILEDTHTAVVNYTCCSNCNLCESKENANVFSLKADDLT